MTKQIEILHKVIDVLVVSQRQVPTAQTVHKKMEIHVAQFVDTGVSFREHPEASANGADVRRSCWHTALNDEVPGVMKRKAKFAPFEPCRKQSCGKPVQFLDRNEERSKKIEVHFARWVGMEYREKVLEKIQRKVRYLHWNRAQIKEGGNGGAVQRTGKGRMEICG